MNKFETAYMNLPVIKEKKPEEFKDLTPKASEILKDSKPAKEALLIMKNWNEATYMHLISMINLASRLINDLNLSPDEARLLLEACATHDRGKEFIDPKILDNPAKLSELKDEDLKQIKDHPVVGALLLKSQGRPDLAFFALTHHTDSKTNAYPTPFEINKTLPESAEMINDAKMKKLKEILAIIDKNDALLSADRPYKEPKTRQESKNIIMEDMSGLEKEINIVLNKARVPKTRSPHKININI